MKSHKISYISQDSNSNFSKGHNSAKSQWTRTKLASDLKIAMVNHCRWKLQRSDLPDRQMDRQVYRL
jgi:hypothetical protein